MFKFIIFDMITIRVVFGLVNTVKYLYVDTKELNIDFISRYIVKISYIGQYQYDFTNRKSVGQKIGKIADILVKYRKMSIFR